MTNPMTLAQMIKPATLEQTLAAERAMRADPALGEQVQRARRLGELCRKYGTERGPVVFARMYG